MENNVWFNHKDGIDVEADFGLHLQSSRRRVVLAIKHKIYICITHIIFYVLYV